MTEQEILRRESLAKLREMGIEPYPAEMYEVTAHAADITQNYKEEVLEDGTKNRLNFQEVSLAGRVMASREAGKAMFMNLQDSSGRVQLYLRRDDFMTGDEAPMFDTVVKKLLDLGELYRCKRFCVQNEDGRGEYSCTATCPSFKSTASVACGEEGCGWQYIRCVYRSGTALQDEVC
jgi:lysyl-tRNA synthetase class 2